MAKAKAVSDEELLRTVGNQLYIKKNWTGASIVFQKLIEISPQDYFAREKLVKVLLADGKAAQAVDMAKSLVAMQLKEPESHYLLGKCVEQIGNYKEALKEYKQAHVLCSANLNYVIAIVGVYKKTGRASDAIDLLKLTLPKHQQLSLLWGYLFESAVDARNMDIAHESLEQFCRLIRQERATQEQKNNLIASGWRMISLDCWRASSYRDQLLLCYSLDEPWPADCLIEVAKKKFLDAPDVFIALSQAISDNAKTARTQSNIESWNNIKKRIEYIRKQAEKQKLAST